MPQHRHVAHRDHIAAHAGQELDDRGTPSVGALAVYLEHTVEREQRGHVGEPTGVAAVVVPSECLAYLLARVKLPKLHYALRNWVSATVSETRSNTTSTASPRLSIEGSIPRRLPTTRGPSSISTTRTA